MKIAIITPYHMNPPSMRISQIESFFNKQGIDVDIIHPASKVGVKKRLMELRQKTKLLGEYDLFIIYDLLTLIALIDFVIKKRCRIIYDVLDYFPGYYAYKSGLRGLPLKIAIKIISIIEKSVVRLSALKVIVNSPYLYKYLYKIKSTYPVYYSSPLERYHITNNTNSDNIIGLYLGLFSNEKGASEIIKLANMYPSMEIHVLGESNLGPDQCYPKNLYLTGRLGLSELKEYITKLTHKGFVTGLSIINGENPSYAVQEANKEIDYLCCGIPIAGNKRIATKEKIEAGCGFYWDNPKQWTEIKKSKEKREMFCSNSLAYYEQYYSSKRTSSNLSRLLDL